jgi:hypothetical protein
LVKPVGGARNGNAREPTGGQTRAVKSRKSSAYSHRRRRLRDGARKSYIVTWPCPDVPFEAVNIEARGTKRQGENSV